MSRAGGSKRLKRHAGAGVMAVDDDTDIHAMLIRATRLGLAIQREYAKLKTDVEARYFVYVLQLQDGKFYVGTTDNIYTRLMDHLTMSASSALWVKHHGPVQRVVEVCRNAGKSDELYKTLQYMSMFGWHNVRGSSYCKIQMFSPPDALQSFARTRDGEFQYLAREEIDDVMRTIRDLGRERVPT